MLSHRSRSYSARNEFAQHHRKASSQTHRIEE
jgi:hypothetical protein